MAEIVIRNLRKEFGAFVAVKESSFTIGHGEFFMLLQPFFLALYSASFGVILFGVLGLVVASKLPE
ncbi:hypothetical protein [Deinococcus sp.]|uniref:hypothetical protein n=1 Tax=Deinococcus sp. TaxID=47478 RepID=UPI00286EA5D1|nr:hypothetical protein [Deinococcus sp.]